MTCELLNRALVDEELGDPPVSLISNPELYCELRDAIMGYLREQLDANDEFTEIVFSFGFGTPSDLATIIWEATRADVFWHTSFTIVLTRCNHTVTVKYDDWAENRHDVVAYSAKLMSRTSS